jgi:hypothetical protein
VVELGVDVEVDRLVVPVDWDADWVLMEPIMPSACDEDEGLDGSLFAWVAFGINSYKVPDWNKPNLSTEPEQWLLPR